MTGSTTRAAISLPCSASTRSSCRRGQLVGDDVHRARLDVEGHLRGGRVGRADLVEPRLDRHLQHVVAAMVAALDLDDRLALGVGAGAPDGVHQRLGTGVGEPDHVELEPVAEPLAHLGRLR